MNTTGIGAPAGDEGGSAAVEERPNEIAGAVALLGPGLADRVIDGKDEASTQAAAGPVGPEAAAEDNGHDGEDATAADDIISPAPAIDTAKESIAAARTDEGTPAAETIEVQGQPASGTSPGDDTPGASSGEDESADDDELAVPQLLKQALESLLDESTGRLVAFEDFECEVDDRAFESEWLGKHTPISLAVFGAEVAKTGKCTFHVDRNGKLLGDRVQYRLARENGAQITLCVHQDLSDDQKRDFILRLQARERRRTGKENRELDRRTIEALLALGMSYETIAKMAGVSPNTVRNIETRAANDPKSKLVNTKRDRRLKWSTPENIAEAHRLRAEGKNNSQIAKALGTTPATIGKLFKDRGPQANAKIKEEPNPTPETAPDQSPPTPSQVDTTRVPDDGIPNVVRLHLEHRGLRGVLAAKEYAKLLKPQQDDAREKIEGSPSTRTSFLSPTSITERPPPSQRRSWRGTFSPPGRRVPHDLDRPRRPQFVLRPGASPGRPGPHEVRAALGSCLSPQSQERATEMSLSVSAPPSIAADVWHSAAAKHPVGSVVRGVVHNVTNYGVFVEIAEGVDGLVHVTDPGLVRLGVPEAGAEVNVRIESFDPVRRRVGLGLISK
jgi:DNA-binding CsgD family transcriptional regulator